MWVPLFIAASIPTKAAKLGVAKPITALSINPLQLLREDSPPAFLLDKKIRLAKFVLAEKI